MKNTQPTFSIFFFVLIGLFLSQNMLGQITINMDNAIVRQDESVCVDLVVEDFDDLIGATFAVSWDPLVLDFIETTNLASIFSVGDFGTTEISEGKLSFQWFDAGAGRSLPDGQVLFSVCFKAIGDQGSESKVRIVGTGGDPGIEILNESLDEIGLRAADAIINISFEDIPDDALFVYYDDVEITEGESFCVPIRVKSFTQIVDLQFSMAFNTSRFRYDNISFKEENGGTWSVFVDANSESQIRYQAIDLSFDAQGLTLDDGDRIFEVCFTHLLTETCVYDEIEISANPLTILATKLNGEELVTAPIIYEPGKILLRTPIDYNGSNITDVTCSEPSIGAISVDASGGTDGIQYLWSNGETTSTISNLAAGTFSVSISDICLAVDTIFRSFEVVVDGNMPIADAGGDVTFDCSTESVMLDGSGSSTGGSIAYTWLGLDGQSIINGGSTRRAEVASQGRYELTVMDQTSGCSATDTVEVVDVRVLPEIMAGNDANIECDDVTIQLVGTGDNGFNHDYEWTTADGNIVDLFSKGGINIDRPGTYTFRITDKSTGCSATDDVLVTGGNVKPDLGITGMTSITCTGPELTLGANISEDSGISYTWSSTDGSIVSGADEYNVVINAPGTYQVTAVNDASGCSSDDVIVIIDRRTMPSAEAGDEAMLGCDDNDITLNGSGSTGSEYEYNWTTTDGSIVSQAPNGQAIVNSAGTYTFTVLETANGCSTSDEVTVTGDNERPLASISGDLTLDCSTTSLNLNANNGGAAVAGLTYSWSTTDGSIVDGSGEVLATIDQAGTYAVRVTNDASGCSDNSTVTVISEVDEPMISASGDESVDCSTEIKTLTVTSDNMTNMNFQWEVIEGNGQIVTGGSNATVEVMGAGKYEIIVTNPLNGCSSRDTTIVSLNGTLLEAEAGMDFDHCESETTLMGNIEGTITGLWTVINGSAILEDPTEVDSGVNSLSAGVNTFVWTLSSAGCPDYSSDTVNVNFITPPVAVDDNFEVSQGFGSLDIDLLNNDQFSSETGATINLSSQPSLGILTENGNGLFTYTIENLNAFGTYTFEYELCDDLCSLSCDIGMVTINVRDGRLPPIGTTASTNDPLSLGITPNGDGLNDQLIFDEILDNGGDYATKRLIVYNRWGDIVHEAQPYNNDWGGTGKNGSLLPQGTYYFVMQLDLGQGEILEGDVTILQ